MTVNSSRKSDYKLGRRIGGGRFSDVYSTSPVNPASGITATELAIKITEPDDDRPPHNSRNELRILRKLKTASTPEILGSGNVIELLDWFQDSIEIGLVFPLYHFDIYSIMRHWSTTRSIFKTDGSITKVKKNKLSPPQIKQIFIGILKGLSFIHSQGIIHRDLNPNNIMFDSVDDLSPVIIDFGISYELPGNNGLESPTEKITDISTGYYKAPELLMSVRNYTDKVDIWSAGVILTLLSSLTDKPSFEEDSQHSDLSLISSIFTTFGSPDENWKEVRNSRSFNAMNTNFFKKEPRPIDQVLPLVKDELQLVNVFKKMMVFESSDRISASDAIVELEAE